MKKLKLKLLLVCALVLFVGAPVVLADWDPQDGHKMHYPQLPDLTPAGMDVLAGPLSVDPCGVMVYEKFLADDWQCSQSGLVTDIHIWGSYNFDERLTQTPWFSLVIYDNVPASPPPGVPFSQPGNPLWSIYMPPTAERVYAQGVMESFYDPNPDEIIGADMMVWQFNFEIDPCDAFEQEEGGIYWLGVHHTSDLDLNGIVGFEDLLALLELWPAGPFGWKTADPQLQDQFMDDGVFTDVTTAMGPGHVVPPAGTLWTPLVYPMMHQYEFQSMDLAFVITGGEEPEPGPKEPDPNYLKWSQPPIEYDPTDPEPTYCGWDELAFTDYIVQMWWMVADDFRCFGSMPIDSIHWWGSHFGWDGDVPPDEYGPGIDPPIIAWRIGFWSNVPADPTGGDPCWSRPDMLLQQVQVPANRVQVQRVGADVHPYNQYFLETCFQYYVDLDPCEVFWQEDFLPDTIDDVFWLSITAMYPGPVDPCYSGPPAHPWGWKTRPWSWMDDGVAFDLFEEPWEGMILDPFATYPLEWNESYDLAFELDTDPCWIKWDQPYTGIRNWPHYEDIPSWMELWDVPGHLIAAADDWKCQDPLPVTALAWYGSYINYLYQPDPCSVPPRPEQPAYFDVSIWTDVPAGVDLSWSHPDKKVWQYNVYDYDEVLVGYDKMPEDPCGNPIPGIPHEAVFRYTARIPEEEWFWQEEAEQVYWLMIVAVYEEHSPQYQWGWTNHEHVYNDDAVQGIPIFDPCQVVIGWDWYEIYDQEFNSADLSFTIYTDPYAEPLEYDFGDAPDDPCAPIYPTLLANDGARHIITGPWFGLIGGPDPDQPDPEPDGQPNLLALGDDGDGNDDEDGVIFPALLIGVPTAVTVNVSGGGGIVEIWIDYNGDGAWQAGELVFGGPLPDGGNTVWVTAPAGSVTMPIFGTFARCRISTQGTGSPVGLASDGEVEDHMVSIEEVFDWGDAPHPPYPTTGPGGARHSIDGVTFLGAGVDHEATGQPDPCALGDDNDGNDDEDGVVFTTQLIPGQAASVNVTAIQPGCWLNAWIDFYGDGDWSDPCDQIFTNVLLTGFGITDSLPFTVPPSAAGNIDTFARFRLSTVGGLPPNGSAPDGEVEDYRVHIEYKRKWSQPPVQMDPCQPPTYYGWDEYSIYGGMQIAGDDWLCEDQRPVSDIHWWGSYYEWDIPEPPPLVPLPTGFHIGIWTDVPFGDPCNMYPYSHPGRMIWEYLATMAEVNEQWVGWDSHEQHFPDACFKYDLQLPEEAWFWQEGPGNIYWLTISAIYDVQPPPEFYWGWKTREKFFNDDAIRIYWPTAPIVGDPLIEGEPILPGWDLAFELTTQECVKPTAPFYNEWVGAGKNWAYPKCWCYERQCRGDADGCKVGLFRVQTDDLVIFANAYTKGDLKMDQALICGDLDHKKVGLFRCQTDDLVIFANYFTKGDMKNPVCPMDWEATYAYPMTDPPTPGTPDGDDDYNFWVVPTCP